MILNKILFSLPANLSAISAPMLEAYSRRSQWCSTVGYLQIWLDTTHEITEGINRCI